MKFASNRIASGNSTDPALNALVEELVDKLQAGEAVDLDRYRDRYPEQAEQLEKILPAMVMMADLGWSVNPPDRRPAGADREEARDADGNPRVLGDFRLLREIGRGGMAVVYVAEQISLCRRVALKVLPYTAVPDSRQRERFQLEARAAALLHHPHIVPVYAVGCEGDQHYYAMQLIEGPSLAAVIRELRRRSDHPLVEDGPDDEAKTPLLHVRSISDLADGLASGHFAPEQGRKTDVGSPALSADAPPAESDDPPGSGRPVIRPSGGPAPGPASERSGGSAWIRRITGRLGRGARRSNAGRTPGFYRATAHLAIQAAEALDHAHQSGVIHRDIKPANLLLDASGHLWVTDFGLARLQEDSDLTRTDDLVGTLRYMSPEQTMGRAVVIDHRTDIYSLGVTLYELLTLTPAISGQDRQEVLNRIAQEEPRPPRRIDPAIPKDLETIVLTAIARDRDVRYPTALEMAEDLRRFLERRPVEARRPSRWRRVWQWAVRHKAAATLIVSGLVLLIAAVASAFEYEHMLRRTSEAESRLIEADRDAARARLDAVQAERDAARRAEQEQLLRNLLLSIERVRSSTHRSGWREEILRLAHQATAIRADTEIRDHVLAAFRGPDSREVETRKGFGSMALAFDRDGRRLLMGGLAPDQGAERRGRVWDPSSERIDYSEQMGPGPVAFRDDGTPLQLVFQAPDALRLWDIARNRSAGCYRLPAGGRPRRAALADDGSLIAAEMSTGVIVWDAATAHVLRELPGAATVLAFSPDGRLLATGDDTGRVLVRSLSTGATVAEVRHRPARILCLRFARDYRRTDRGSSGWLLAAGGTGGSLVIWDLDRGQPRSILRGVQYETFALAFNTDSTLLASSGRQYPRLWDVAHGACLLDRPVNGFQRGIALSPDGKRLASSTIRVFFPDLTILDELEDGRGFRTLRGPDAPLQGLGFSPSGRLVVGMTHDFQVGVWDLATGRLRFVRDAPEGPGFLAIGAAMAISPDESRLALCGGSEAQLWDLSTGRTLRRWPLPPGTFHVMDFAPSGRSLLVARVERRSGREEPFFNRDPADPNVVKLRDLLGPDPARPIRELEVFPEGHICANLPGFRAVVLHGIERRAERAELLVRAYDGRTGDRLWTSRQPLSPSDRMPGLVMDPPGSLLGFAFDGQPPRTLLISAASGRPIATLDRAATALGLDPDRPGGSFTTRLGDQARGFALFRNGSGLIANLGIDDPDLGGAVFHPDGRHLLWSNGDGEITDCDLHELRDIWRPAGTSEAPHTAESGTIRVKPIE